MVARTWLVPYTDAERGRQQLLATIYLTHNNVTGQLQLDVRADSKVVVDGGRARVVVGKGHTIPFSVGSNVGRCSVHPKATGLITRAPSAASRSPRSNEGPSRGWRPSSPRRCQCQCAGSRRVPSGKNYYQLVVQADGGEPKLYRKRYSEFAEVHDKMKQAYVGSHLRASLPAPPAKILNPFFDQLEPTFVQNRQVELNDYVKKIITVPRALAQPALLDFLGLALRALGEPVDLLAPPPVDLLNAPLEAPLPPPPPVFEEAVV